MCVALSTPPANKPNGFLAPANHAAVLNEVIAFTIRVGLLELHRLPADDARHQVQQWTAIIIH
jgi:hypothetical protein